MLHIKLVKVPWWSGAVDLKRIGNKTVAIFLTSEKNNTLGVNVKDQIEMLMTVHTKETQESKYQGDYEKILGIVPPKETTINLCAVTE